MSPTCSCRYEYKEDGNAVRVDCVGCIYGASIEDFDSCFGRVIDIISEVKKVSTVIMVQTREYEYDWSQTKMLVEVARILDEIVRGRKLISIGNAGPAGCRHVPERLAKLQHVVLGLWRSDPIGAYVELVREIRKAKGDARSADAELSACSRHYLERALLPLLGLFERAALVQLVRNRVSGYHVGDRSLYREIFHPTIRPNFMLTRYMEIAPPDSRPVDKYKVGDTEVEILRVPDKPNYVYHVSPPEFKLTEEKYTLLDAARRYMASHEPRTAEFAEPQRSREVFLNIDRDLIRELSDQMRLALSSGEVEELAKILTRYTAGLGILEVLLADERIQDIYVNSPVGRAPIFIYHADYQECETNLIPTREDADSWATRFRIASGRPLDEANPVLDTDITVPGGSARVCSITRTLSPDGLGFAFRRHRDRPWTLPLFIKNRMMDPLAAGLLSFLVDGSASLLVAGGRGSGKTSLLGALMVEVMPSLRICTVEDSVTGDCRIVFERNGKLERKTIGELIDGQIEKYGCKKIIEDRETLRENPDNIKVFSLNSDKNFVLSKIKSFIRHKVSKDIFEIETRTGRKIKVTGDHSLFVLNKNSDIAPAPVKDLQIGDHIVTPRYLPISNDEIKQVNILEHLERFDKGFFVGEHIRNKIAENWQRIKDVSKELGYSKMVSSAWKRNGLLPLRVFVKLMKTVEFDKHKLYFKYGPNSRPLPVVFELDDNILTFIGLWLADGCYDKKSVIISVVDEELREVVRNVGRKFNIQTKMHSDEISLMLNSVTFKSYMERVFGLIGDAYTKKIPDWAYDMSKTQIAAVLKGIFSGDGHVSEKEIVITLASESLIRDIQSFLLFFGVIGRVGSFREIDKTFPCRISSLKGMKEFREKIGFLQSDNMIKLRNISAKTSTHDSTDIIPFHMEFKETLPNMLSQFNYSDYVTRGQNIGREKLKTMVGSDDKTSQDPMIERLNSLANSDIFWDEIKSIKKTESEGYVYDLSVPENENFVCENILAHNTMELPTDQLRNLGYNIERMKSRSVITRVETEMPADEALRTALRLGDSVLIIGEVRSVEAKALYEAMRIGALSNLVAGTIHGESAYGVYDRVVNDLGVPPTSFKATDIVLISKMLRSADGLHKFRRLTEVAEVRKHWKADPAEERGFVNLMEYSAKTDQLKPTDTLVHGESEVINRIAGMTKDWEGRWDAVWENIQVRAKIKQMTVDAAAKLNRPELLEAPWVMKSNAQFHLLGEKIRNDLGALDSQRLYSEWLEWFNKALKV